MKKLLYLLVLLPSILLAEGPLFRHKEPEKQQEFENVYKDLRWTSFLKSNTSGQMLIGQGSGVTPVWQSQVNIMQIATGTLTTDTSTTNGTFTASGLTVSITPTSTSSKILILCSGSANSGASNTVRVTLARGTTNLGGSLGFQSVQSAGATAMRNTFSMVYLDSPLTTSATSYNLYFLSGDAATTVEILATNRPVQIVAVEIK